MTGKHYFLLWFGAAISMAEILTGGFLAPLGFKMGLAAILLGHALGNTLLVLAGSIGFREKLPAIMSTRLAFGTFGSYLASFLNLLQLIGWTAVMLVTCAGSVNNITKTLWGFDSFSFWVVLTGTLVGAWSMLGKRGWKTLNSLAVFLLLGLTVIMSRVVFTAGPVLQSLPTGEMSFGSGLELSIILPLSWLPLISDYTQHALSERGAVWGSWLGYFIGSSWMFAIGLGAALVAQDPDPTLMMLALNLGIAAMAIIILSTITTTFLNVHSAVLSTLNIFASWNEKWTTVVVTLAGIALGLYFPIMAYENFLYMIGSVFSPLFAVLLTDYYLLKADRSKEPINWKGVLSCILGIFLYYRLINLDLITGATLPVMLITAGFYLVLQQINVTKKVQQSET